MVGELEKQAVKEDLKAALSEGFRRKSRPSRMSGIGSKLDRVLGNVVYGPTSYAASLPGKAVGSSLGNLLLGPKVRNPLNPMYGRRVSAVPGTKGLEEISRAEYNAIREGSQKGKAYKFKGEGHFRPIYYKRKYAPGGAVGFVKKHPLIAGGGGLLAYYLMKNPQSMAAAREMLPKVNTDVSPEVTRQWKETNAENPFQRRTWG